MQIAHRPGNSSVVCPNIFPGRSFLGKKQFPLLLSECKVFKETSVSLWRLQPDQAEQTHPHLHHDHNRYPPQPTDPTLICTNFERHDTPRRWVDEELKTINVTQCNYCAAFSNVKQWCISPPLSGANAVRN